MDLSLLQRDKSLYDFHIYNRNYEKVKLAADQF